MFINTFAEPVGPVIKTHFLIITADVNWSCSLSCDRDKSSAASNDLLQTDCSSCDLRPLNLPPCCIRLRLLLRENPVKTCWCLSLIDWKGVPLPKCKEGYTKVSTDWYDQKRWIGHRLPLLSVSGNPTEEALLHFSCRGTNMEHDRVSDGVKSWVHQFTCFTSVHFKSLLHRLFTDCCYCPDMNQLLCFIKPCSAAPSQTPFVSEVSSRSPDWSGKRFVWHQ